MDLNFKVSVNLFKSKFERSMKTKSKSWSYICYNIKPKQFEIVN